MQKGTCGEFTGNAGVGTYKKSTRHHKHCALKFCRVEIKDDDDDDDDDDDEGDRE